MLRYPKNAGIYSEYFWNKTQSEYHLYILIGIATVV